MKMPFIGLGREISVWEKAILKVGKSKWVWRRLFGIAVLSSVWDGGWWREGSFALSMGLAVHYSHLLAHQHFS